ncbi:conserved Plasmodium protein, unknown function [Babesia microti strain RI]|uniref:Uncharacterized protein n=1 Tax=Babesia microti (strain RI) TaxID=1133968 RepID=A0A1N6LYA7_BABMR|nr:conserved Plasmodium protein, unknown function [Babesia microti strain RI]SIO73866.1 conserved Plasmodium protein, unknown function [Babesia microti strain RI]|eukprot:XP_021337918.1 conserved Plasmodium protein, unknown function [Babesia microti strain RI]
MLSRHKLFAVIQKRCIYWPPKPANRSKIIELPSGKRFFVFLCKRDVDGKLEPAVVFTDSFGNKLATFNTEEVYQLKQLIPRLETYFKLYEKKSR